LPQLLPPKVQLVLLERLLYRDLSDPSHRTNLHLHYDISYPPKSFSDRFSSFFSMNKAVTFSPKNPSVHKPISTAQFLGKKLRWMTLGGQYDWTAKRYPSESPPPFPADLKQLLKRLFPEMDAQAAIVNFYSPGDTLSVHRDVSEDCDQGLVSISIGCDALFVVGNQDGTANGTMMLRSGDAVYMTGSARYAWHGVPKIIPSTCPEWLATWPAPSDDGTQNDQWLGWMYGKRINLNVRQIKLVP
jgi:DNA alkylation damage repair protein AlkB